MSFIVYLLLYCVGVVVAHEVGATVRIWRHSEFSKVIFSSYYVKRWLSVISSCAKKLLLVSEEKCQITKYKTKELKTADSLQ